MRDQDHIEEQGLTNALGATAAQRTLLLESAQASVHHRYDGLATGRPQYLLADGVHAARGLTYCPIISEENASQHVQVLLVAVGPGL